MAVSLSEAWNRLAVLSAQRAGVDLAQKLLAPDPSALSAFKSQVGAGEGAQALVTFYGLTNGLDLSGYLPDVLSDSTTMPLSILPVSDVLAMYEQNREEQEEMGEDEFEGMDAWQQGWLPFAWDGATGYQCVDESDGRVVHYDLAAYAAQDCAASLAEWFDQVADKIESGELEVFNI